MRFREFEQWCFDQEWRGYLKDEKNRDCLRLLTYMNSLSFWKRRKVWKEIEDEIVERIVIPVNMERRFDELESKNRP